MPRSHRRRRRGRGANHQPDAGGIANNRSKIEALFREITQKFGPHVELVIMFVDFVYRSYDNRIIHF